MTAVEFTAREQRMMALAWKCFDGEPKVDFNKLARLNGMTNTGSAYNAWTKIRKKLAGETPKARKGTKQTPKRASKKRARRESDESEECSAKRTKACSGSALNEGGLSDGEVSLTKVENGAGD